MAKTAEKEVEQQQPIQIMWSTQELAYRDDLKEKLLTLDHVKSILEERKKSSRSDSEDQFIIQIDSLRGIVENWIVDQVELKKTQVAQQHGIAQQVVTKPETPGDETEITDEDDEQ